MASVIFTSTFLLLFAGARAQAVDLGKTCTASDTCTNSLDVSVGLACDFLALEPTCAIKVGQSCAGYADGCVTGATCDTDDVVCRCSVAGYEAVRNSEYCVRTADKDLGESCSNADICSNKADLSVDLTCDFLAVKRTCAIQVGQPCNIFSLDTCVTGAVCDNSQVCRCLVKGYVQHWKGELCIKTSHKDLDDVCARGDSCSNKADLSVGLACDTLALESKCAIRFNQPCASNPDKCMTGAQCDDKTKVCTCKAPGYEAVLDREVCRVVDGRVGGYCQTFANCGNYTKCDLKTCTCRDGYKGEYGAQGCVSRAAHGVVSTLMFLLSVVIALRFTVTSFPPTRGPPVCPQRITTNGQ